MDEDLRKYLLKKAREDKRVFEGYSAQSDKFGPGIVKNVKVKGAKRNTWVPPAVNVQFDFNLPRLQKRTEAQRVESMTRRLMEAVKNHQPGEMQLILQQMSAEGWKAGSPVSYEEVKRVAIEAMKTAAAKKQEEDRRTF